MQLTLKPVFFSLFQPGFRGT